MADDKPAPGAPPESSVAVRYAVKFSGSPPDVRLTLEPCDASFEPEWMPVASFLGSDPTPAPEAKYKRYRIEVIAPPSPDPGEQGPTPRAPADPED